MTRTVRGFASAAVVATVLVVLTDAGAAQPAQPPASQENQPAAQSDFVPIKPGELEQEQLPAAPLVFIAYSVVWLALVFYVFLLWRRLTTVERELRDVSSKLQARRP